MYANFNSIKVQLEHYPEKKLETMNQFQFHKGTIRTPYCMFLITSSLFQFHKGTIRTVYLGLFGEKHFHFNSIKVQLERYAALKKLSVAHQFQFHKGTIRTRCRFLYRTLYSWFQFHKGTIRTGIPFTDVTSHPNFNSIKVQLELMKSKIIFNPLKFQFHKGTIRT